MMCTARRWRAQQRPPPSRLRRAAPAQRRRSIAEERRRSVRLAAKRSRCRCPSAIFSTRLGHAAVAGRPGGTAPRRRASAPSSASKTALQRRRRRAGRPRHSPDGAAQPGCPAALNSAETTSPVSPVVTAKETSVGGTSMLLEGAAHGILAADGGHAQLHLRLERAQQRRQRLAPALGVAAAAFRSTPGRSDSVSSKDAPAAISLADRLHHRQIGARGRGSSRRCTGL